MNRLIRSYVLGKKSSLGKFILLRQSQNNDPSQSSQRWKSKESAPMEPGPYFIAAQAEQNFCTVALVTEKGKIVKSIYAPFKAYQHGIFYEMSSKSVWQCMTTCIKRLTEDMELKDVKGIGFISTPALVCLDHQGNPVTVSVSRDPNFNCIAYFDQRSILETEKINETHHALLQYFGERALPELQESKMMWLKNNLKEECWNKVGHFMDLSDYLTFEATGSYVRSSGVLISKWSYEITVNGNEGWNPDFFNEIGLPEITEDKFKKIGTIIQRPGTPIANGLTDSAAKITGLPSGLPVATSLSDALAGGLGIVGCQVDNVDQDVGTKLCIVFGSRASHHLVLSHNPVFVKGVWGPFKDSILPDMWLNQGGQTTAESLMDYIIARHPAVPQIKKHLGNMHIHKYLNKILKVKAHQYKLPGRSFLTRHIHILPDFDGNRSPLADPRIRGMVSGISLLQSQESLALTYLASMQSLAYSTRSIVSRMTEYGHPLKSIVMGGDLSKNSLFMYLHKDICQMPTVSPDESRCKLIGAAILAAIASNHFQTYNEAIQAMCGKGQVMWPDTSKELMEYHNKKYQVFLKMYEHQLEYRRIMSSADDNQRLIKSI